MAFAEGHDKETACVLRDARRQAIECGMECVLWASQDARRFGDAQNRRRMYLAIWNTSIVGPLDQASAQDEFNVVLRALE